MSAVLNGCRSGADPVAGTSLQT
ncbi:MAG: hypothetical protein QOI76_2905, partial [Frankiales bacterium]|nr:hypothetical protein [Frankiales bacterium]